MCGVGERLLQVKCRVIDASSKKSQTFSPFRSFEFDSCVFVILDSISFEVIRAIQVEREQVKKSAALSTWVAGSRVTVRQVLAMKDTTDVTAKLRDAQVEVDARGRLAEHDVE